jgi:hypothetical protein
VTKIFFKREYEGKRENENQCFKEGRWVSLWNGEDIQGFYLHQAGRGIVTIEDYDAQDIFEVQDGMLYTNFDGYALLITMQEYSWYELRVDYRFETNTGDENAGLVIHVDNATMLDGITGLRAASIEVNMRRPEESQWTLWSGSDYGPYISTTVEPGTRDFQLEEDGGVPWTNDPWGNRIIRSTYPNSERPGEWNTGVALVMGDSMGIFTLNGQLRTMGWDFTVRENRNDPDSERIPWTRGGVGLQSEAFGIWYRNFEIRNIIGCMDSTAANYGSWYVKDSVPSTCLYAGCKDEKFEEYNPDADMHDPDMCLTLAVDRWTYTHLPSKAVLSSTDKTLTVSASGNHSLRIMDISGHTLFRQDGRDHHEYRFGKIQEAGVYILIFKHGNDRYMLNAIF